MSVMLLVVDLKMIRTFLIDAKLTLFTITARTIGFT